MKDLRVPRVLSFLVFSLPLLIPSIVSATQGRPLPTQGDFVAFFGGNRSAGGPVPVFSGRSDAPREASLGEPRRFESESLGVRDVPGLDFTGVEGVFQDLREDEGIRSAFSGDDEAAGWNPFGWASRQWARVQAIGSWIGGVMPQLSALPIFGQINSMMDSVGIPDGSIRIGSWEIPIRVLIAFVALFVLMMLLESVLLSTYSGMMLYGTIYKFMMKVVAPLLMIPGMLMLFQILTGRRPGDLLSELGIRNRPE